MTSACPAPRVAPDAAAAGTFPVVTLALAACAVAVFALPGATTACEYDRSALARGEIWRALTGHVAHFDFSHLAWDVATLVGLGVATERESRVQTAVALLAAAIAVSAALWVFQPAFETYRGLSGLDCALGGLVAGNLLRRTARAARLCGAVILCFVAGKCAYELHAATPLFAHAGGYAPAPLAHLVGFAAGVGTALLAPATSRRQTRG